MTTAISELGIEIRAGVHTGECELTSDDVEGLAVHIGARVAAKAGPGDVVVSNTVRDLVAGSGIACGAMSSSWLTLSPRAEDGAPTVTTVQIEGGCLDYEVAGSFGLPAGKQEAPHALE